MKTIIGQAFMEYVQGVYKGSMNRLLMFVFGITACAVALIAIWTCGLNSGNIASVIGLVGTIISPIFILGGFSMVSKNTDIKNSIPNPNLPKP